MNLCQPHGDGRRKRGAGPDGHTAWPWEKVPHPQVRNRVAGQVPEGTQCVDTRNTWDRATRSNALRGWKPVILRPTRTVASVISNCPGLLWGCRDSVHPPGGGTLS